jgi:hypothetical protein
MRAVAQPSGPRLLRIGVVQGGKVVDERVFRRPQTVTVGRTEDATLLVSGRGVPQQFPLFELVRGGYVLNYLARMNGRVRLEESGGPADLAAIGAEVVTVQGLEARRVALRPESRGQIVIGDSRLLFQFVAPPPPMPRAHLPATVKKGFFGDLDWFTTVVAAVSFMLHFALVALVYSDWMDPVVDDDVRVAQLLESVRNAPPPPPLEQQTTAVDTEATAAATAEADKPAPKRAGGGGKGKGTPGKSGGGKAAADAKAFEIAAELAELDVATVGALGSGKLATDQVLGSDSDVPTGLLDEAGRSASGAGSGGTAGLNFGGSGSGAVKPGAGGAGRGLKQVGDTGGQQAGSAAAAGTAKKVKGPVGSAMVGGAGVAGGNVANASSVVARMRGRFRRCYQQGLNQNPEMQGSATLTAKIGPNGEVLGVGGGATGSLGPIVPCLKAVVRSGNFAPPEGGSAVVSIPITFVKQGG